MNSEAYMAHYIASYPDFDQILAVTITSENPLPNESMSPATNAIAGRDDSQPHRLVAKDKKIIGQVDGKADKVGFDVDKQVHYEGD